MEWCSLVAYSEYPTVSHHSVEASFFCPKRYYDHAAARARPEPCCLSMFHSSVRHYSNLSGEFGWRLTNVIMT